MLYKHIKLQNSKITAKSEIGHLHSTGGSSSRAEGPTTANDRCWARPVVVQGTKRSSWFLESNKRNEVADKVLLIMSERYLGARPY